jgi:hypothetical protein
MNLKQILESNNFSEWEMNVYKLRLVYWNNISLFKFSTFKTLLLAFKNLKLFL